MSVVARWRAADVGVAEWTLAWTLRGRSTQRSWTLCGRSYGRSCGRCMDVTVDVRLGARADVAPTSRGRWSGRSLGRCVNVPLDVRVGERGRYGVRLGCVGVRMDARVDAGKDARMVCCRAPVRRGRWNRGLDARVDFAWTFHWMFVWTVRGHNVDIRMDSRVDVGEDARVVCGGAFARRGRWSCRADARVDVARTFQWTFVWALR